MTFADSLRLTRRYLEDQECGWAPGDCGKEPWGVCQRCAALAALPDPEDVEGLEKSSPTYWLELGRKMGTLVRQKGELEKALARIATIDYRGNEHESAAIAREALKE